MIPNLIRLDRSFGIVVVVFTPAILLWLLLWHGAAASAAELFVKTNGSGASCTQSQPCSLQSAISQGSDGDTIYIAAGTYTGTGANVVNLNKSVALYGGWNGSPTGPVVRDPAIFITLLDGQNARRVVGVSGGASPTLDGLTLTNGHTSGDGGAVLVTFAQLTLANCLIVNNYADKSGGGVYVNNSSSIALVRNKIADNEANVFTGGGVYVRNTPAALLHGNHVTNNNANQGGGGIFLDSADGAALLANTILTNTTNSFGGGGLFVAGSQDVELSGNVVSGNSAGQGAGIYLNNSPMTRLTRNTIINNISNGSGGGIAIIVQSDSALLDANTIIANTASGDGAGIQVQDSVNAEFVNNILAGNRLDGLGGNGSGIFANSAAGTRLWHTTLVANNGGNGQGIHLQSGATAVMTNTILVSHTVGIQVGSGTSASLEATLWGSGLWANGADTLGSGLVTTGTLNLWDDPGFVAPHLSDYHLDPSSPAIDSGLIVSLNRDVDFEPRPYQGYDLGADEYWPPGTLSRIHLPVIITEKP